MKVFNVMKNRFVFLNLLAALLSVALMVSSASASAVCVGGAAVRTTYEQTVCPGTDAARTAEKSADFSITHTYPGCETLSGTSTSGTRPIGGGGGGVGGYIQSGGGGGGYGGSPILISPEECSVPAGGAGTAGGDNGNPGSIQNGYGGSGDSGCGGDAGATCPPCEPVTKKTGSLTILTNGTYTFDHEDLRIPGRGNMDVLLRRVYRSNRIIDKPTGPVFAEPADDIFGFGWTTPLTVKIVNGDTFVDADGRYFTFKKDDAGNFLTDAKSGLTLKQIANGFTLNKLDAYTRTFDVNGKLLTKSDNYGNSWTLNYDAEGLLNQVLDPVGRIALTFTYNSEGRVDTILDLADRSVSYGYDAIGNLIRYTDPAGNDYAYEYNTYHGITSKSNPLNETFKITYLYADKGVVASVMDPIGSQLLADGNSVEAKKHKTTLQYDFQNKTFYSTDKNGRQVKQTVNGEGQVTSSVDTANGKTLKNVEYLPNRIEKVTDETGNVTLKQKDEWGNLLRKVDGEGNEWLYTYTTGNRLASATDPLGVITRYEYDNKGNVTRQTQAADTVDAVVTDYEYNAYGQLTARTIAGAVSNATTTIAYDVNGLPEIITDHLGHKSFMEFDAQGNLKAVTDALNNRTAMTYDDLGNVLTVTDPLNNQTKYSYNIDGRLEKVTDALLRETTIETDFKGRILAVIDALNNKKDFIYDGGGNLLSISQDDVITSFAYDESDRLISVTDAENNTTTYDYAEAGCSSCGSSSAVPETIIDPFGNATKNLFDKTGKVVGVKDPLSNLTSLAYDAKGQVLTQIDGNGNVTKFEYDQLGRLTKQINAEGGETLFTYDQRDNLITLTDPEQNTTTFEYDKANRKTKEIRPMGQETVNTYYDNGLLKTVKDAKQQTTTYAYDRGNLLAEITYADDTKDTFVYDNVGNLTSYANPDVSGTITFDKLNRKLSETVDYGSFQKSFSYTYDVRGNKATYTSPEALEHVYTYRKNDQLQTITVDGNVFTFDYAKNRLNKLTFPNGVVTDYGYNQNSWLIGISTTGPSGNILTRAYTHDSMGNIDTKNTEHGLYQYSYDKTSQLTSSDAPTIQDENYSYDKAGNRLTSLNTNGLWSHNANNEMISDTKATYEYDENGNTVKKVEGSQITVYEYSARNRLSKVFLPDGRVSTYTYDPFGRRVKKQVANISIYFAYVDEGLVAEYTEQGAPQKIYGWKPDGLWGTDPLYQKDSGRFYYYHNDHLFTPQLLTTADGQIAWATTYEVFGKALIDTGLTTVSNNLRFPGQYEDNETGLYYNFQRFYDPTKGHYVQVDPLGFKANDTNLYRYVFNAVNTNIDPLGLSSLCDALQQLSEIEAGDPERLANEIYEFDPVFKNHEKYLENRGEDGLLKSSHPELFTHSDGNVYDTNYVQMGFAMTYRMGKSNARLMLDARVTFKYLVLLIPPYTEAYNQNYRGWQLGALAAELGSIEALREELCDENDKECEK